jgi:transcriptional regulator with XRE-family HTH domain
VPRSPTPQLAIGRAIGLCRLERDLKQDELADAAGISDRRLREIEAGTANPSMHVIDCIARALGLAHWEIAKQADELETQDRRPTNRPLKELD